MRHTHNRKTPLCGLHAKQTMEKKQAGFILGIPIPSVGEKSFFSVKRSEHKGAMILSSCQSLVLFVIARPDLFSIQTRIMNAFSGGVSKEQEAGGWWTYSFTDVDPDNDIRVRTFLRVGSDVRRNMCMFCWMECNVKVRTHACLHVALFYNCSCTVFWPTRILMDGIGCWYGRGLFWLRLSERNGKHSNRQKVKSSIKLILELCFCVLCISRMLPHKDASSSSVTHTWPALNVIMITYMWVRCVCVCDYALPFFLLTHPAFELTFNNFSIAIPK